MTPSIEIRSLDPESPECQATYTVRYRTEGCYDLRERVGRRKTTFAFRKIRFSAPVEKSFDFTLGPEYFRPSEVLGIFSRGTLAGLIEIHKEEWNGRLRITEFLVFEPFRRMGLGGLLLEAAKGKAREAGCRGLVLETQSCNLPAIACYLGHGFRFIGFDSTCYSNEDVLRKEVRLEMGLDLSGKEG